jgi:hypothetical protein
VAGAADALRGSPHATKLCDGRSRGARAGRVYPGGAGAAPASQSPAAAKGAPNVRPVGPNPFLALVPDATKVDYRAWGRGTIDESGVSTIGIAQSIDPGNFDTEESALVLLDLLSDPGGPDVPYSLNTYMTSASDRIAFVGQAVGNVTAHEAGHFFGNWHTDNSSPRVNLMDAGGENFQNLFGVGPDQVGGTADDVDVDFGDDAFEPEEGFVGIEDTLGRIVFGVTS